MATRRDRMARADAFVIERLRAAGAVVFGKVTMHEGALGATNESPLTGRTYNPHRAGFTPGGSSGGSGAAVAAGFCLASLGTDTLGSVRIPAAYCGVVGHKPTKGLVGNRGVVPLSWTLDHVGPLTRSVRDAAAVLAVLAVFDPIDAGAEPAPVAATEVPALPDLRGVTLGRLVAADRVGLDPEVAAAWARALDVLRESGATLREVDLPPYDFGRARRAGLLIAEAEGAFAHAGDLAERAQLLSPALRAMLSFGRDAKTGALVKAQRLVADVVVQVRQAMAGVDALVLPTAPQPAFDFSRAVPDNQADLTSLASLTGRPAVSVPMGFSRDRLPLGLQLIGHPFGDGRLLAIAAAYEAAARWDMRPIL
jgi:aspartyl-tRNA(Asn)/glutamyl-tRNA(Gln) amidotransferase subunit A